MKLDIFFKKSTITTSLSTKSTSTASLSTKSIDETLLDSSSNPQIINTPDTKKKDIMLYYNKNGKTLLQKLFKPIISRQCIINNDFITYETLPRFQASESEMKDFGISSEHIINDNYNNDNIFNKTSSPFLFRKLHKRKNKKSSLKYKNYDLDFINIYNNKNKYFYK